MSPRSESPCRGARDVGNDWGHLGSPRLIASGRLSWAPVRFRIVHNDNHRDHCPRRHRRSQCGYPQGGTPTQWSRRTPLRSSPAAPSTRDLICSRDSWNHW